MKTLTLIFFLVVSFPFCIFAVQQKFINGYYYPKDIQFKGSREFQKLNSFLSQDKFVLQRLPHFQTIFYKMQNSKRNGAGANNSNASATDSSRNELLQQKYLELATIDRALAGIKKQREKLLRKFHAQNEIHDGLFANAAFTEGGELKTYEA